jgi:predicted metal-dependent hydrolase
MKKNRLPLTLEYAGIGPVRFVRSPRARRINIRIRADGEIRVTLPAGAPLGRARKFVEEKREWIARHLAAARRRRETAASLARTGAGLDREKAAERILVRLAELADEFGFSYNRVTLRNQKTRWGSCSAGNNLSLNLKLALLDDELLDLVLVHELLHTEIKNHGPEFKQKMAQLIPDAARLDRRLKEFSGLLRTPPVGG